MLTVQKGDKSFSFETKYNKTLFSLSIEVLDLIVSVFIIFNVDSGQGVNSITLSTKWLCLGLESTSCCCCPSAHLDNKNYDSNSAKSVQGRKCKGRFQTVSMQVQENTCTYMSTITATMIRTARTPEMIRYRGSRALVGELSVSCTADVDELVGTI